MIALLVGTFAIAGVGICWYGYKASLRIATWGRNMDEQDRIFQMMDEQADHGAPQTARKRTPDVTPAAASFAGPLDGVTAAK